MEEILRKMNIDRDSLNSMERETLERWSKNLQQSELSLANVKEYISGMIESLEREVAGHEYPKGFTAFLFRKKRMRHLQARLYNYILLRDFLTSPEKARSYIEKHISQMAK